MIGIISCLFIIAFVGVLYFLDHRTRKGLKRPQLQK
jgi:hypothetical protein